MSTWFDDDDRRIDPFNFNERGMVQRGISAVRGLYGTTGAVALIAGIALLISPTRTLMALAIVLGAYFLVSGILHLIAAIGVPVLPAGWRALSVVTSLLLIFGGIFMLRNQAASAATLATFAVLIVGCGWIIEGVMTLLESGLVHNRWLAIASGVLSIVAGAIVFIWPVESTGLLVLFAGISLAVLGAMLVARAFTFGRC